MSIDFSFNVFAFSISINLVFKIGFSTTIFKEEVFKIFPLDQLLNNKL